ACPYRICCAGDHGCEASPGQVLANPQALPKTLRSRSRRCSVYFYERRVAKITDAFRPSGGTLILTRKTPLYSRRASTFRRDKPQPRHPLACEGARQIL